MAVAPANVTVDSYGTNEEVQGNGKKARTAADEDSSRDTRDSPLLPVHASRIEAALVITQLS